MMKFPGIKTQKLKNKNFKDFDLDGQICEFLYSHSPVFFFKKNPLLSFIKLSGISENAYEKNP